MLGEIGLAFLAQARDPFAHLVAGPAEELEGQRRVERRTRKTQPVVERVLGQPNSARRASRELGGDIEGGLIERLILDTQ